MTENQPLQTIESAPPLVSTALLEGTRRLSGAVDSYRLDAELLLGHVLRMTRAELLIAANHPLGRTQWERYEAVLARRLRREPVAYITGRQEFWSLEFTVTREVLIPRPETERLVEIALGVAARLGAAEPLRILDLGTGSGAIAIAVASELPRAQICGADCSVSALALARRNAARNGVADRVQFLHSDLFAGLGHLQNRFDLILSNPPYVRRGEIARLEPEVSRWEPRGALDGGVDGLDYYRRMAAGAFDYLTPNGAVVVEIGADMGASVTALFAGTGAGDAQIFQDYSGKDRVVVVRERAAFLNFV
jgi:release factor glutamine methyltransferase